MERTLLQHLTTCVLLTVLVCAVRTDAQGANAIYRHMYQPEDLGVDDATDEHSERWKPLSSRWGMPDATAHVGKVFRYTIPSDAFSGDILRYEVTEADSGELPSWLYFDSSTSAIEGIPSEADIGQYYISVTAVGHKTNTSAPSQITEVFSVNVAQQDIARPNGALKEDDTAVICPNGKIPAVATIVLDADWSKLPAQERVAIVAKMSKYSMLKIGAFSLQPKGRKATTLNEKLLVTGPGNKPVGSHNGISLSWKIGCGENAANLPVVTILETAAQDASMAEQFGLDIIGWQVTGQKPKPKMRVRRQVNLAGTPMPTPMPSVTPTSVVETSRMVPSSSSTPVAPTTSMTYSKTVTMVSSPTVTPTPTPTPTDQPTTPSVTPTEPLTTVPPMTSTTLMTPAVTSSMVVQPTMTPTIRPTEVPKTPKPVPVNKRPMIHNRINRVDAREGVPLVFVVPADTFMDEDGNTRDLTVDVLDNNGMKLNKKSWVRFDKRDQMLHGMPPPAFPNGKSRMQYIMTAQDSEGMVVRMPFELVIAAADDNAVAPPVTMGATLNIDFDEFISNPKLQLEILNRISSVFGDDDASAITITAVRPGSVILSWTNNTIGADECPSEQIAELMAKLMNPDGTPTQALIDALAPDYTISGVDAIEGGPCITTTPVPPKEVATVAAPVDPQTGDEEGAWIGLVPAIVVVLILLLAGIIILLLYRKHRKGKLSDEDNNTFINKGIPIILPDEIEEAEKPADSSSSPLIMSNEKPPLPPPEYNSVQEGSKEPLLNGNDNHKTTSDDDDKNSLPMADIQRPEPPPQAASQGKQTPVNTPGYRVPPPYVPP